MKLLNTQDRGDLMEESATWLAAVTYTLLNEHQPWWARYLVSLEAQKLAQGHHKP